MRLPLSFLAAAVLAAALAPLPALAVTASIKNDSPNCAWITWYRGGASRASWVIVGGKFRPRFVQPGRSMNVEDFNAYYLKARAEVMPAGGCAGNKIDDVDYVTRGDRLALEKVGNKFRIRR